MIKLLFFFILFFFNSRTVSNGDCGTIGSNKPETPNEIIHRLNGADLTSRYEYIKKSNNDENIKLVISCSEMMQEFLESMIEELYKDKALSLDDFEAELDRIKYDSNETFVHAMRNKIEKLRRSNGK